MRKVKHPVCKIDELEPNVGKTVSFTDGGECTLFLNGATCHAVGSLCPHQNAPLDGAVLKEGEVICRRHGYRFDVKSGDCRTIGGYGIPIFDVSIEEGTVFVSVWEFDD